MALLANMGLFFVLYLPLTYLIGMLGGFYVGPTQGPDDSYPLFIWVVVVWPLLLPSFLWVPIAHILLRIGLRRLERNRLRLFAVLLVPAGFLVVHLWVWGGVVMSPQLLTLAILPGAVYGLVFRIPASGPRTRLSSRLLRRRLGAP